MPTENKKRIGILRGGPGEDYVPSLKKGGEIISYISENLGEKYRTIDILVDKNYIWHYNGVPVNPGDLTSKIDIAWNTTHASLSNILDSLSIPNVHVGNFTSAFKNSKNLLKDHVKKIGIAMPRSLLFPAYQEDFDKPKETYALRKAKEVFEKFSSPWIVKSYTQDSSMGIHLAKTFPELVRSIEDGVSHGKSILVEEFIAGKVVSVHTVPMFRGEDLYAFPLGNSFGAFSGEEKEKLIAFAKDLHRHIDARHYLKADFVMNSRGKVYLLEIESMPDLNLGSHFYEVCESVGAKPHQVIEHILDQVLR